MGRGVELRPYARVVPYEQILKLFAEERFDPGRCIAVIERLCRSGAVERELFDLDAIRAGGCAASDKHVWGYDELPAQWSFVAEHPETRAVIGQAVAAEELEGWGDLLRAARNAESREELEEALSELEMPDVTDIFKDLVAPISSSAGAWMKVDAPGIYRREHASLIFRSETTTLMTDPQCLSSDWMTNMGLYPCDRVYPDVDAVLISHGHGDHWSPSSAIFVAGAPETPIIAPPIPRPSLLSPDHVERHLQAFGQRVMAPQWWSSVTIGDFTIQALPFYGEQPRRRGELLPEDLRNWGSCYRITCPLYSAVVLVDAGADPAGDMVDAIAQSVERDGPIDVVLSCTLSFNEAINEGLPSYHLVVPFRDLPGLLEHREPITLGPSGVARACRAAQCHTFLSYAAGFHGLGRIQPLEEETTRGIESRLTGSGIEVQRWAPGDHAVVRGRGVHIQRAA